MVSELTTNFQNSLTGTLVAISSQNSALVAVVIVIVTSDLTAVQTEGIFGSDLMLVKDYRTQKFTCSFEGRRYSWSIS